MLVALYARNCDPFPEMRVGSTLTALVADNCDVAAIAPRLGGFGANERWRS